jgi:WD40 repeat protein
VNCRFPKPIWLLCLLLVLPPVFGKSPPEKRMAVYVLDIDTNITGEFSAASQALTLTLEAAFSKHSMAFQVLDRRHLNDIVKANKLEKDLQAVLHGEPAPLQFAGLVIADGFIHGNLVDGPDGAVLTLTLTRLNSEILWQGQAKHTKAEWQLQKVQKEESAKLAAEAESFTIKSMPDQSQKKQGEPVSYKEYEDIKLNAPVRTLAFSGDGGVLAFGTAHGTVGLISMAAPSNVAWLAPHKGRVNAIALSQDGSLIASAGDDGHVNLTAMSEGNVGRVHTLRGRRGKVFSVAFAPEGQFLASSSGASVSIWSTTTHNELYRIPQPNAAFLFVAFTDRGSRIIGVREDGAIFEWDVNNRAMVRPPTSPLDSSVSSVSASASGALLSIGTVSIGRQKGALDYWERSGPGQAYYKDRIIIYGVEASIFLKTIESTNSQAISMSLSPDNRYLAVVRRPPKGSILSVININSGTETISIPVESGLRAVAFSPDGQWLAMATDDGHIRFLQMRGIQPSRETGDLASRKFAITRTHIFEWHRFACNDAMMDLDAHETEVEF